VLDKLQRTSGNSLPALVAMLAVVVREGQPLQDSST
jgi:hypothetical protein